MYEYLMNAPHILIGGTTGSGKSVLLNGIICDLIESKAKQIGLYLIDPKRVELYPYSKTDICECYTEEADDVPAILNRAIAIINDRYEAMRTEGVKDYAGKNIYIVIDELADLMISENAREIKSRLQKILQIGRAAGVHIIAATQAPNREVIPASLVLNFTDRIALRCLSSIESRQLINVAGAEKIKGYGKGLYMSSKGISEIEIPLVTEDEIAAVCEKHAIREINLNTIPEAEEKKPSIMPALMFAALAIIAPWVNAPFGVTFFFTGCALFKMVAPMDWRDKHYAAAREQKRLARLNRIDLTID